MKFREKLVVQTVICMMIFAGIRGIGAVDIKGIREAKAFIGEHFQRNYTSDDIKTAGSQLLKEASNLHTTVTSAVLKANEPGKDNVLGKADRNGIQMVYAINSGNVTAAGIDEEKGTFIKIENNDTEEIYGNLNEISVLTGEKVWKGDIIGTFDSNSNKEFIYQKN